MTTVSYRAKHTLLPDCSIVDGRYVTVADGVITDIGSRPLGRAIDLGEGLLMPGLVNPHTHLEFSLCESPIGQSEMLFSDWIGQVIQYRISIFQESPELIDDAITAGIAESISHGVTSIGDITTCANLDVYRNASARIVSFRELLGVSDERELQQITACDEHCDIDGLDIGLSPHAPYTVAPSLLKYACNAANVSSLPVAMHLAETCEELQLIESRRGRLYERLCELDAWNESAYENVRSLNTYIQILASAAKSLIIHGNYLTADQLDLISEFKNETAIVYCPRTHKYFGHSRYPLQEIHRRGIPLCLGTDSRSSNPDLDLWSDLLFVREEFPEIAAKELLKMVTSNPAHALGLSGKTGCIEKGLAANLVLATTDAWDGSVEQLVQSRIDIESVFIGGVLQHK